MPGEPISPLWKTVLPGGIVVLGFHNLICFFASRAVETPSARALSLLLQCSEFDDSLRHHRPVCRCQVPHTCHQLALEGGEVAWWLPNWLHECAR